MLEGLYHLYLRSAGRRGVGEGLAPVFPSKGKSVGLVQRAGNDCLAGSDFPIKRITGNFFGQARVIEASCASLLNTDLERYSLDRPVQPRIKQGLAQSAFFRFQPSHKGADLSQAVSDLLWRYGGLGLHKINYGKSGLIKGLRPCVFSLPSWRTKAKGHYFRWRND